jgi:ligand-binding SRPBCC domain-containing protein
MALHTLTRHTRLAHPIGRVFEFFSRAENLEAITPPWLAFRILTPPPIELREGALIEYALRVRGLPMRWVSRITDWNPPHRFTDVQVRGPYRVWEHTHSFVEVDGGTEMTDSVRYALPFGPLGEIAHRLVVARDLRSIFDYRARRVDTLMQHDRINAIRR